MQKLEGFPQSPSLVLFKKRGLFLGAIDIHLDK